MEIPKYFNNSRTSESRNFTNVNSDRNSEKGVRILSVDRITVEKIVLETCKSRKILLTKSESSRIVSEQNNNLSQQSKSTDNKNFLKLRANAKTNSRIFEKKIRAYKNTSKVPILSIRNNSIPTTSKIRIRPVRLRKISINDSNLNFKKYSQTSQKCKPLKFVNEKEKFTLNDKSDKENLLIEENIYKVLSDQSDEDDLKHNKDRKSPEDIEDKNKNIEAHYRLAKCQYEIEQLQKVLGTKINFDTAQIYKDRLPTFHLESVKILPIIDDDLSKKEINKFDKTFINKLKLCTKLRIEENILLEKQATKSETNQIFDSKEKQTEQIENKSDLLNNSDTSSSNSYVDELDTVCFIEDDAETLKEKEEISQDIMDPCSSKSIKEEKKKKGIRRLLPGIFSPKESRKSPRKDTRERKRRDDKHHPQYQQNGNYSKSIDSMKLNEDIRRNVTSDPNIIEDRMHDMKQNIFPLQGIITSTPDHFSESNYPQRHASRHYEPNSSYNFVSPETEWIEQNIISGSPDMRKLKNSRQIEPDRHCNLERKHSFQEPVQSCFIRNHGPSGRISAPPSERYLIRSRVVHPMDRPLPAIPQRIQFVNDNQQEIRNCPRVIQEHVLQEVNYRENRSEFYDKNDSIKRLDRNQFIDSNNQTSTVEVHQSRQIYSDDKGSLNIRAPKYSPSFSQKSGDYADSSYNSSQKSGFSPTSSKSGEYYLNSPHASSHTSPSNSSDKCEPDLQTSNSESFSRANDEILYDDTRKRNVRVSPRGNQQVPLPSKSSPNIPVFSSFVKAHANVDSISKDESFNDKEVRELTNEKLESKENFEVIKDQVKNLEDVRCKDINTEDVKENFENVKENFENVRENFENVKGNFENVRENFENVKENFENVKENFEDVKENFEDVRILDNYPEDRVKEKNLEDVRGKEKNLEDVRGKEKNLEDIRVLSPDRKQGVMSEKVQGILPDRIQGMLPDRIQGMLPDRIQGMLPDRIQGMTSPDRMQGMRSPDRIQGVTSARMQIMPSDRIQGMRSPDRMQGMRSPDRMQGMTPDRVQGMPTDRIQGIPTDRIQGMSTPNRIQGMRSPDRVQGMVSPDRMQGLPSDRIQGVSSGRTKRVTSPLMIIPPVSPIISPNNVSPNANSQGILKETNQQKAMSPLPFQEPVKMKVPEPIRIINQNFVSPRKAQPSDQILIASPKRDIIYDSPKSHSIKSELVCPESPIPIADSPSQALNSKHSLKLIVAERACLRSPVSDQIIESHKSTETASSQIQNMNKESLSESPKHSIYIQRPVKRNVQTNLTECAKNRDMSSEPLYSESRPVQNQPNFNSKMQSPKEPTAHCEKIYNVSPHHEEPQSPKQMSPSKKQTMHNLETYFWQQKALDAQRKNVNSPTVIKHQPQIHQEAPEIRDAMYWQKLKKLDEEQQRRFYEQNQKDERNDPIYWKKKLQTSPTRKVHGSAPSLFQQTCSVPVQEGIYWENKGQRANDNVVGKPPRMGQKVQNQPVLVVRPQPVAQERSQKIIPQSPSVEPEVNELNRCQSASPRFLINDDYRNTSLTKSPLGFESDDKVYSRAKEKGNPSLVRKPQTPPIYEEDIDIDRKPPPIFKRGSLISNSNSSIEYGTMGQKRVSFSNQANCPTIGYGKWPTKHGMAPEPPTRRNKEDDARASQQMDSVKIYGNVGQQPSDIYSGHPSNIPVYQKNVKVNNLKTGNMDGDYDANKPLPPPPREASWSLRRTASLRETSRSIKVESAQLKNEVTRKWSGLSESESGSEAGEVQRIFHRPDKKWTRSYDETESRTYENIIQYRKFAYVRSQSEPRKKSDVIPIESLKPFRKMLNRWKSKEKKSSSGDGSGSKRKRKFGREEEEWNPDGKGRQGNDIGGTGRTEGEGANDLSRCGSGGGGGGVFGGGSRGSSISGSGGGSRSRDEPRRHTLSGDHQPSLHHQQFNTAQQIHPLHPHHLPTAHNQYGTLTGRHTMDLEMGTKSRQRKAPFPRGYPPPSTAMLFDDDPGIMSEVETSSTGFRRGGKQRSSLPVVRTPSKTLERPLGLVFLQYRSETKRALLPNEITSIDTVKALFVRSFPKQLTMEYLDSPHVKVYIHDSSKDMFYELEDLRSHLRDIRDRSVLRLFESSDGMPGPLGPAGGAGLPPHWEDQSYFSEPEFDSEFQHQHIHKSKNVKNSSGNYYIGGSSTLPRGGSLLRAYSPAASSVVGPNSTPTQAKTLTTPGGGVAPAKPLRSYQGGKSPLGSLGGSSRFSRDSSVSLYSIPDRIHGEGGYMSSPERGSGSGPGRYPPVPYSGASSYEDPYYSQYSGTVTPVIDEEASDTELLEETYTLYGVKPSGRPPSGPLVRSPFPPGAPTLPPVGPRDDVTRLRVENMERQLANLTGIVQKALIHPQHTSPSPRDYLQIPAGREPYTRTQDKSVSFEKSVSFSDEPPDMNSPKQHSPQHAADTKPTKPAIKSSTLPRMSSQERERERHKPTPPPKPVALTTGQYVYGDLTLAPEMYNQLRVLQKKAKDLNQEKRNLRRMAQAQSHTVRESIRDAYITIRAMLMSLGENAWAAGDSDKLRLNREEDLYKQEMLWLEKDLTGLESTVEELRGNVINRKTRVNMSDVENMALILNKASKTVADLKVRFPSLQEGMKGLLSSEMEKVMREEKFLKEEPDRLESVLKRCKKLTGTLVTLKRLASVQEQRLPNAGSVDVEETPPITPTSTQHSKTTAPVPAERTIVGSTSVLGGGPHVADSSTPNQQRPENALDALLDELQTFSRPASQLSQASNTSHPPTLADLGRSASHIIQTSRAPNISDIGRKGSIDSTTSLAILTPGTNNTLRRLHSYPSSSDTDTSPPIARLQVSDANVTPQKPPVPERNAELLQLATARRVPPPPPPRTSSRSPLASPTSPQLPPRNPTTGTLRRNRNNGKPPMALPATTNSEEQQPPANNIVSTSNSSSCESVNSQEGIQNKKGRHEQLEQRHQELLRRQKVLQEQYTRLQQFQNAPPAPSDLLKKTGSESNLLAKMGLGMSTTSSGSLTSLLATKSNSEPNSNNIQNATGNQTTTNKIYETDIL